MKISNSLNSFQIQNSTQSKKQEKVENKKLSRVEEIKQKIQNGEYKVDINKTAKAMLDYLLK